MDFARFEERLDALRAHFQNGHESCVMVYSGNSLGYITTQRGTDGSSPHLNLRGQLDTSSSHAKLATLAWWQEALEIFLHLDCELRSIPALWHHDIHWGISMRRLAENEKIRLPAYRINIMGNYFTDHFVKTSKNATSKLRKIEKLLAPVPSANPARRFRIDKNVWPAHSPEAMAHLWAAIHDPKLLSRNPGPNSLPEILEVHDRTALLRSLQPQKEAA